MYNNHYNINIIFNLIPFTENILIQDKFEVVISHLKVKYVYIQLNENINEK